MRFGLVAPASHIGTIRTWAAHRPTADAAGIGFSAGCRTAIIDASEPELAVRRKRGDRGTPAASCPRQRYGVITTPSHHLNRRNTTRKSGDKPVHVCPRACGPGPPGSLTRGEGAPAGKHDQFPLDREHGQSARPPSRPRLMQGGRRNPRDAHALLSLPRHPTAAPPPRSVPLTAAHAFACGRGDRECDETVIET